MRYKQRYVNPDTTEIAHKWRQLQQRLYKGFQERYPIHAKPTQRLTQHRACGTPGEQKDMEKHTKKTRSPIKTYNTWPQRSEINLTNKNCKNI